MTTEPKFLTSSAKAQLQDWFSKNGMKGYASASSGGRVKKIALAIERMKEDDIHDMFMFVEIESGKHKGRVVPTIVCDPNKSAPRQASEYIHMGILVFQERITLDRVHRKDVVGYVKKYAHLIPGRFDMRFLTKAVAIKLAVEIDAKREAQ